MTTIFKGAKKVFVELTFTLDGAALNLTTYDVSVVLRRPNSLADTSLTPTIAGAVATVQFDADVRGTYRIQGWTREPASGQVVGYTLQEVTVHDGLLPPF